MCRSRRDLKMLSTRVVQTVMRWREEDFRRDGVAAISKLVHNTVRAEGPFLAAEARRREEEIEVGRDR